MKSAVFITYPGALASSIFLPAEMLTAAGQLARAHRRGKGFQLDIVTLDGAPAPSGCGTACSVIGPTLSCRHAAHAASAVASSRSHNDFRMVASG